MTELEPLIQGKPQHRPPACLKCDDEGCDVCWPVLCSWPVPPEAVEPLRVLAEACGWRVTVKESEAANGK